jgi:hypothetical protein
MVAEKTKQYQGKNKNLGALGQAIAQKLQSEGYKVQSKSDSSGTVVQAQKAGILRDIISADRAFTILITGQPNDFSIRVGIGKLVQNLAVTAVEVVLVSGLFLAVDVPEMLWTTHVEKGVIQQIDQIVESPAAAMASASGESSSGPLGSEA